MQASDWSRLAHDLIYDASLIAAARAGAIEPFIRAGYELDEIDLSLIRSFDAEMSAAALAGAVDAPFEWMVTPGFIDEYVARFETRLKPGSPTGTEVKFLEWFTNLWRRVGDDSQWRAQVVLKTRALVGGSTLYRCSVAWRTSDQAYAYVGKLMYFITSITAGKTLRDIVDPVPDSANVPIFRNFYQEDEATIATYPNPFVREWRWSVTKESWKFVRELSHLVTALVAQPGCTGAVAQRHAADETSFAVLAGFPTEAEETTAINHADVLGWFAVAGRPTHSEIAWQVARNMSHPPP